jgi:hypothetical protein
MSTQIIPVEFRGLARQFRRQVDAADIAYIADLRRITLPMQARLSRKPTLRPGMIIDIEREFRTLNHPYRLALNIDRVGAVTYKLPTSWSVQVETVKKRGEMTLSGNAPPAFYVLTCPQAKQV